MGQLRVARAGRVADDRGEVDDRLGALERARRGVGVADVAVDHLDAPARGASAIVLLAVQQRVEHAHLAPGVEQLVDDFGADVAGATGDQDRTAQRVPPCSSLYRFTKPESAARKAAGLKRSACALILIGSKRPKSVSCIASASASRVAAGTSTPVSPSITVSRTPPRVDGDHRPPGGLGLDGGDPELLDVRHDQRARAR